MVTVIKITVLPSLYTFRTSFTGMFTPFTANWCPYPSKHFLNFFFFNFLGMWFKGFRNLSLGLTCFAMLFKGNLREVKSHSQLCGEKSTNSCTCFDATAPQVHQENSMATIKDPHKKEIHIGAFVPFMKDDRYGYYTAMKMAIYLINNRTDILDNYTLVLDSEDTIWVRRKSDYFHFSFELVSSAVVFFFQSAHLIHVFLSKFKKKFCPIKHVWLEDLFGKAIFPIFKISKIKRTWAFRQKGTFIADRGSKQQERNTVWV